MNTYTLTLCAIAAIAAIFESNFDAKKNNPEHRISAVARVVIALCLSFLVFYGVLIPLLNATAMLITFWIVFDPAYSYWKHGHFHHMGKTAVLDKIARRMGSDMYGWTALKCVFLAVTLTILSYNI